MIQVNGLTRRYGDIAAVSDLSFSVAEGEIIGFLGPNGAGKTTTMNMITGCLRATAGTVTVDGADIETDADRARKIIGYLPENPPLYPDMTVDEYLEFVYRLKKCRLPQKEHLDSVCDMAGLSDVRGRLIRNLSKGYRQRVGFAQALIGDPPLLILDEPTVGLDPQQIIELRELIASLREKHTVILSSHILTEIAATCARLVVLSSGHLAADSTLDELLKSAGGQAGLLLQADASAEKLMGIVRAIGCVLDCRAETDEAGHTQIRIYTQDGADIHRELFTALSKADCPIRSLRPAEVSLEDVFLQLTHDSRYKTEE